MSFTDDFETNTHTQNKTSPKLKECLVDDFLSSHHLFACQCISNVRRNLVWMIGKGEIPLFSDKVSYGLVAVDTSYPSTFNLLL